MRISDWSSDVCSSDLLNSGELKFGLNGPSGILDLGVWVSDQANAAYARGTATTGQERANFTTTAGGLARPTTLNCGGGGNASLAFKQIGRAACGASVCRTGSK